MVFSTAAASGINISTSAMNFALGIKDKMYAAELHCFMPVNIFVVLVLPACLGVQA